MRNHRLFAEDFDRDREPDREPSALVAMPDSAVDTEVRKAELAHVWEEGRQAGLAAARAEQRAQAVAALTRLEDAIQDMNASWLIQARTTAKGLAQVLCTTMATMLPALCARHGAGELRAIIAEILPELVDEADVRLRVMPAHAAFVSELLTDTAINVQLVPDPRMGPADIHIEWRKGEAKRDTQDLWARIMAALAPVMGDAEDLGKDTGHVD